MKKYLNILAVIIGLTYTSCDDEIQELQPFTQGNPESFFNSVSTFQNGVDGIYSQIRNYYMNSNFGFQGLPDILGDNVVLVQTGRRSNEVIYDYRYNPNTTNIITLWWSEAYEAINVANLVIGQIDNLADGPDKDNILGQALAARAYAHFDLARVYAQIPTQSANANASPGIVYIKVEDGDTEDPFAQPTRETVGSNYAEIIGDLERAVSLIGDDNGEGRLDRDAVNGILSRVYLYNGDYQKAIDASDLMATPPALAEELEDMYTDETNTGIVWELAINTTSESSLASSNVGVIYSQSNAGTTISEYAIDFEFWSLVDPNDLRRNVMQFVGTNQGNDYNAVKKFLGETGQVNGRVDIKVMRAAEVLLNKAEAQFELGLESDALTTLDELRAIRFTSFTGGESGQALEDAIQFNRRVELSFEGHRFFDIKRRGESVQRSNFGDIIDGSGTPAEVQTLPAGDFRFQLPIPVGETNANTNFVQNDGY